MVRPRPTWTTDSPTTWVKKTAEPAMKVPSPRAKSSDWVASRPASGDGGVAWCLAVVQMLIGLRWSSPTLGRGGLLARVVVATGDPAV